METCLILPAAGRSSRMRLPYPKEIMPLAENTLLIDMSLLAAREAGIEVAYIVTNNDKLRLLSQMIGPSRHDIRLVYVLADADQVPDCDAGSAIRGCRRAQLADGYTKYLVAFPDCWMPRLEMKLMLDQVPMPGVMTDEHNNIMMAHFDLPILGRLRRRLLSQPKAQHSNQMLFSKIVREEMVAAGDTWSTTLVDQGFVNVDTWDDFRIVRNK